MDPDKPENDAEEEEDEDGSHSRSYRTEELVPLNPSRKKGKGGERSKSWSSNEEGTSNEGIEIEPVQGVDEVDRSSMSNDFIIDRLQRRLSVTRNLSECPASRSVLTVTKRHDQYLYSTPEKPGIGTFVRRSVREGTRCSLGRWQTFLLLRFPLIGWIINYNIRTDLIGDIISGVTVAIMHIPQGMAYAMLADLDPICGIYMAFFPVVVYAFFASSQHCSMGTFAVICLMTGKLVAEYSNLSHVQDLHTSGNASNVTNVVSPYSPTEVSTIVCFGVGIWMLLFGLLRLGSLAVFLSDMLISGFTTGAAIQVLTSQVKSLLGLKVKTYNGAFKVILTWRAILSQMFESNSATVIISIICIIILLINNEFLKPRLSKITRIPIPIELIIVVCGTVASKFGFLNEHYGVIVVGHIPTGLPPPVLPPFSLLGKVILPCLTIAIVSYSVSFSMAKIFAKKKDYILDPTQEMYAIGLGNLAGSLFKCAPISASLSRSLIQFSVGGATQITSLISCTIIVLVLLFIGPFFESLPNCVLAAIIVTALKGMFMQVSDFTHMWRISKVEAGVWLISFWGVVLIDIEYGLFIGIGASLLVLIGTTYYPVVTALGRVPNLDIYLDNDRYSAVREISGVKICHVAGLLHFANLDSFRENLVKCSGIDPKSAIEMKQKLRKEAALKRRSSVPKTELQSSIKRNSIDSEAILSSEENGHVKARNSVKGLLKEEGKKESILSISSADLEKNMLAVMSGIKYLIIDFSGTGHMDFAACKNLAVIYRDFTEAGVSLLFSSISDSAMEMMEKCKALEDIPEHVIFHSLQDAVAFLDSKY